MKRPVVSVFLSYYNDAKFLRFAIDSVLGQDFQDFELILLNHATTDNCREIARSYHDERIIHIDKDFNYGAGSGLLIRDMLSVARGKYIKFFCADDVLHKNCLATLVDYMEKKPNVDAVCSDMDFIDKNGRPVVCAKWRFSNAGCNEIGTVFNRRDFVCYPTVMMKKDVLEKLFIDPSFIMRLDTSLFAQILSNGGAFHRIDEKLVSYRFHDGQTTHSNNSVPFLEEIPFADVFCGISDVKTLQDLCGDVKYSKDLSDKDKKYFPFILAIHNLKAKNLSFAINGYLYIHNLMNDDKQRQDIEQRFGFTIKDFRDLYKTLPALKDFISDETKKLNIFQLMALIARRIFHSITPKAFKRYAINFCVWTSRQINNKGVTQ